MKTPIITGAVLFCFFFLVAGNGYCENVDSLTFGWDAPASGEQITGYKLCLGGTSRGAVLDYTAFRYDREIDVGTATQYTVSGLSSYTSVIYASVVAFKNTQLSNYSNEISRDNTPSTTSSSSLSTTTTTIVITQPATTSSIAATTIPETASSSSTSIIVTATTTSSVFSTTTQPIDKPYDLRFRWNKR